MILLSVHLITFLVQFPWWYKNQFPQKLTFSSIAVCGRILTWSSISGNLYIGLFLMLYIWNYYCLPSKTVPPFFEIFWRLFIAFETWNIACITNFNITAERNIILNILLPFLSSSKQIFRPIPTVYGCWDIELQSLVEKSF